MLSGAANNALFWNPHPPRNVRASGTAHRGAAAEDDRAMEDALAGLAAQARGNPLATPLLTENIDYRANVLVGASRTQAGRVVARVTFAPGTDSADVKIGDLPCHAVRLPGQVRAGSKSRNSSLAAPNLTHFRANKKNDILAKNHASQWCEIG